MQTRTTLIALIFVARLSAVEPAYKTLEPGLDYARVTTDAPQLIHLLRIDRAKPWEWTTAHAEGRIFALAPLGKIVRATERAEKARAVAAVNGDFYAIAPGNYQGDPLGLQIVAGEVISSPNGKAGFWVDGEGKPHIDAVESKFRVAWTGGATTPFGLNEPRPDNGCTLFTPALCYPTKAARPADFTTRTTGGRELVLEPADPQRWLPFAAGSTYRAKVTSVREGGNSPLTPTSVVLSLGPKLAGAPDAKADDELSLAFETTPSVAGSRCAIGGGPRLLKAGTVVPKPDGPRHPRSLLGWNETHSFLVVVEGRRREALGMTLHELAELAKSLGCVEALNLDGGGSSTLWADNRVLNAPTDGEPRPVANGLLLIERPTSRGR
ncbi:MAG: phosphodiester glycosidase family protein [Gemmataceae bacterium]